MHRYSDYRFCLYWRCQINGQDAVLNRAKGTYIPLTEGRLVSETINGTMYVRPAFGEEKPTEFSLRETDRIELYI